MRQPLGSTAARLVDAAATDDAGDLQDFDTIGTISVVPVPVCPGDCTNDAAVSVDELILGVNIALGNAEVSGCPAFDGNGSGSVDINGAFERGGLVAPASGVGAGQGPHSA